MNFLPCYSNLPMMRNLLNFLFVNQIQYRSSRLLTICLLALCWLIGNWHSAQAESPETAPAQLKNELAQLDLAANKHDIKAVMQFYSQNFSNSDGLTRQNLEKALTQLWQRYPNLTYQTQLLSWQPQGRAILAETVTTMTSAQTVNGRNMALNSTIRSLQHFEDQKISQQGILSEISRVTNGNNPPQVSVNLPQQVRVGQKYEFDAIVQKPLGDEYLLGAATTEPVTADKYLGSTPIQLELLPAGGLFKQGQAPTQPQSLWVSGVLIGAGGTTMITQRLQVVNGNVAASAALLPSR